MMCFGTLALLGWAGLVGATITGQTKCTSSMCITGTHDDSTNVDTYTLAPPEGTSIPLSDFGWMAIGWGTKMSNSPMVIVWPNSDGTITLSQRSASGHSMPTASSSPARIANLSTSQSFSNSSSTSITFTLPSDGNTSNNTDLIWAWSDNNPSSSSDSASIQQHKTKGTMSLALLADMSSAGETNSAGGSAQSNGNSAEASGGGDGDDGDLPNHKALLAHAICGALAIMLFMPIGTLVPRLSRGISRSRWWFPTHAAFNGLLAGGLVIAAFAIANSYLGSAGSHSSLATVLLALVIAQIVLGLLTHTAIKFTPAKFKTRTGRGPINYIHWVLGIATIAIGFATIYTGLFQQWPSSSGTGPAKNGWKVGWAVVVGVFGAIYIAAMVLFLPKQVKREREMNALGERNDIDGIDSVRQVEGEGATKKSRFSLGRR